MNQIDENRTFDNLFDCLDWAIYLAWTARAKDLTITPVAPSDPTFSDYQTINIYLAVPGCHAKRRYTARYWVYLASR